ncbi:MAG: hypothetical protein Q8R40_00180 [bacterium]|nr:hypothetical protein [bacterium]
MATTSLYVDTRSFGRYEVLKVSLSGNRENWRIDLGIKRRWPWCWIDHRPWERFPRRFFLFV